MYDSLDALVRDSDFSGQEFWKLIQVEDCREEGLSEEESFERMSVLYEAMLTSDKNYDPSLKSSSGMVGTDAAKLHERRAAGRMLCNDFMGLIMEKALKVSESNACMKRIVAAPTAGSCGVVPAVLLSVQEKKGYTEEDIVKALYVAAGIGGVIANRACLAGAEGGCQAEIGSASAMAAGALTYLLGGTAEQTANAAALALKSLLGLACDPVAGLVEVPCVKRNVIGAVNAVTAAEMSMAGIESVIPPDEVIDAMRAIGRSMDASVRETGNGGLAATPTGNAIKEELSDN